MYPPAPDSASPPQRVRLCHRASPSLLACDSNGGYFVMRDDILDRHPALSAGRTISWHLVVVLALSCSSSHACRLLLQA